MVVKYGVLWGSKKGRGEKGETRNTRKMEAGSFTLLSLVAATADRTLNSVSTNIMRLTIIGAGVGP